MLYTFIVDPVRPKRYSVNEPTEEAARAAVARHVNERGDYLYTVEPDELVLVAVGNLAELVEQLGEAERTVDALTDTVIAANAAGELGRKYEALGKIAEATARRNRLEEKVLLVAHAAGLDFVSVPCGAYTMNYALEGERWEPFVSNVAA